MDRGTIRNNIRKEAVKVFIQAIAFVIYYILLIILGFALFVGAGWVTLNILSSLCNVNLSIGVGSVRVLIFLIIFFMAMWWLCIKIGLYLLKPLFTIPKNADEERYEIRIDDAPKLFAMVGEIAMATGNRNPKHIYLTAEVNASVSYNTVGIWSLFFPKRKNLTIGIGLLQGLNQSEMKAIISHEFGHFSQQSMRMGIITYRLLLICRDMAEYARKEKKNQEVAKFSGDYRWYFHLATYPISVIASITIAFFNHIEKRNKSLSRFMEFEADVVACHIAGCKPHISALCKVEIVSSHFDIYEQMIGDLLQERNSIKSYFDGYSFVYEQLSKDEDLYVSCLDTLAQPVGDNALFPSRISVVDGWNNHPSLQERITNAKQFENGNDEIMTDSVVTLIEKDTLDSIGIMHQHYIAKKIGYNVQWTNPLTHEDFIKWALKTLAENSYPYFIIPFLNKRVVNFQIISKEDIANENVDYPFTNENRNLILEYNQAMVDMQTLIKIVKGEYDAPKFIYNGKLYKNNFEPLRLQRAYVDNLYNLWKCLDIKIYKYLLKRTENELFFNITYWMKMYASDALDRLMPLYSYANEIKEGMDFYNSNGGSVSMKDKTIWELRHDIHNYLNTLDYETISSICGDWIDDKGNPVKQVLDKWKEYATQELSFFSTIDGHVLDLIEQVWQFLSRMFSVADMEWRKQVLAVYYEKNETTR